MQTRELRQVEFNGQPIRNIVGAGGGQAYHFVVNHGARVATMGLVTIPAYAEVCNDGHFARNIVDAFRSGAAPGWMRRILATLRF